MTTLAPPPAQSASSADAKQARAPEIKSRGQRLAEKLEELVQQEIEGAGNIQVCLGSSSYSHISMHVNTVPTTITFDLPKDKDSKAAESFMEKVGEEVSQAWQAAKPCDNAIANAQAAREGRKAYTIILKSGIEALSNRLLENGQASFVENGR